MSKESRAQAKLNKQLLKAAWRRDLAGVKQALAAGADIEARGGYFKDRGTPLILAAYRGAANIVEELLARGADIEACAGIGGKLAEEYAKEESHGRVLRVFAAYRKNHEPAEIYKKQRALAAPAVVVKTTFDARDISEGKISFVEDIGGGSFLVDTFNFVAKERRIYARKGPEGEVTALSWKSFAEMADQAAIHRAFAQYQKKGGTIKESDVFTTMIDKSKLGKGL